MRTKARTNTELVGFHIKFTPAQRAQLEAIAEDHETTAADVIRRMIKEEYKKLPKK